MTDGHRTPAHRVETSGPQDCSEEAVAAHAGTRVVAKDTLRAKREAKNLEKRSNKVP